MKNGKSKKPVSPIYTIGLVWLLYSFLIHPISTVGNLLLVAGISAAAYGVVRAIVQGGKRKEQDGQTESEENETPTRTRRSAGTGTVDVPKSAAAATVERQKAAQDQEKNQQERARRAEEAQKQKAEQERAEEARKAKYPPEVQAIVDEGTRAHRELARLYASIPDLAVKRKVQAIMEVSDKIIADAVEDPADVPQIKKFLDYYLPTTIKLLNAYDRMGAQGVQGANISGTMQSINEMLDTAIDAYRKLLDSLFANQAIDVETDIQVMNTLLQREGFIHGGGSAFQVKKQ
ncbi:MAG: 5-bromo-4-chloroindolyl phosphate hydrolysis family protein [Oscillospiraceae bacterium]|nr:5-bromo-4-chloroindolyl phosphate hydrolysis family protein [Oscillospiraceae bacterium]